MQHLSLDALTPEARYQLHARLRMNNNEFTDQGLGFTSKLEAPPPLEQTKTSEEDLQERD